MLTISITCKVPIKKNDNNFSVVYFVRYCFIKSEVFIIQYNLKSINLFWKAKFCTRKINK